jgi:4-amino-4-deoxy-L-arabinose transferase-like glycosyltransferase
VLALFLGVLPSVFLRDGVRPLPLVVVSVLFFLAIGPAVSMIDGYRVRAGIRAPSVTSPYTRADVEYFGDVPALERTGPLDFLRKYSKPRLFETLSLHTRTHPPGGVFFHWLVSRVFGYGLWPAALATLAFTALAVPLVYVLARDLSGPRVARTALALFLVTPNFVMFTTTSMDGPFSVFPLLGFWLFVRALRAPRGGAALSALAGLALALATFMTYAAVFALLYVGIVAMLEAGAGRTAWKRAAASLAVSGTAALAFYVLLALAGYDAWGAVRASMRHDRSMMGTGYETLGRYFGIAVANLVAFLIGIGVASAVLWLRALAAGARMGRAVDPVLAGGGLVVLAMAFSTLFTLEVERIWLFMVPFVVVAAAAHIEALRARTGGAGLLPLAAVIQGVQLFAFEVALRTNW